jgi:copper chaperone
MQTIQLTAPDISCEHCKHTIESTVGALQGVQSVNVEIEPKLVTVQYDPAQVDRDAITAAMEEEGYPVRG